MDYAKQAQTRQYDDIQAQEKLQAAHRNATAPDPPEPGLRSRLQEALTYLGDLADAQTGIRMELIGPEPSGACGSDKVIGEPSIEFLLSQVCQRAAMCANEAHAIRNRL